MSRERGVVEMLWAGDLTLGRHDDHIVALAHMLRGMLGCRCGWEMKRKRWLGVTFWACEMARPWNFWRHDVQRKTPTRRAPCM